MLEEARQKLLAALGPAGLVDAAATLANFQRMDRVADATGIALDGPVHLLSADLRHDLGIDAFAAAANSAGNSALRRRLGALLRPLASRALRLLPRRRAQPARPGGGP